MRMRRAVLMMRQAISPRLAIRILLNISAPTGKTGGLPLRAVSIGTMGSRKQPRAADAPAIFNSVKHADAAAVGSLSIADFDPPPSAFETRAGEVAAVSRRPNRPSERRPGPRMSAEPEVAWADHPGDWFGRVGRRLRLGRARLRKDAQHEDGGHERGWGFYHPETLLDRGQPLEARVLGPYPNNAGNRLPQGVQSVAASRAGKAIRRLCRRLVRGRASRLAL